jgi:hypothetical protein
MGGKNSGSYRRCCQSVISCTLKNLRLITRGIYQYCRRTVSRALMLPSGRLTHKPRHCPSVGRKGLPGPVSTRAGCPFGSRRELANRFHRNAPYSPALLAVVRMAFERQVASSRSWFAKGPEMRILRAPEGRSRSREWRIEIPRNRRKKQPTGGIFTKLFGI